MLSCPKQIQVYRPRRPEKTVLFEVIKKHYTTWYKNAKDPVPHYVDKEFKKYLGCGILAKGFACAHCDGCNKDFFIAFSCKGRGICPSCNTRSMVEVATHLVEKVIPCVLIRQFVISFPMRIRHYLQKHKILQDVLRIVVDEIRKRIIACSPDVTHPQIGAVSFIQHFGKTLNFHPHFHLVVTDGTFNIEGTDLQFHEACLTPDDIADTQDSIQKRVLNFFGRRGWFDKETIEKMLGFENSGFSLDASIRIESWDRDGLERLIRYCARPPFASENLRKNGPWLIYRLPKPTHTGQTFVQIDPLEFIERISAFVPHPRSHRRHYHGIFAPNSPLRKNVVANAKNRPEAFSSRDLHEAANKVTRVSLNWAKLIAQIYEVDPLICPSCGNKITIIAFVTHAEKIRRILKGTIWPVDSPEFDPPYDFEERDICQLIPGTQDGFPEYEGEIQYANGTDPPCDNFFDSPNLQDHAMIDPPIKMKSTHHIGRSDLQLLHSESVPLCFNQ